MERKENYVKFALSVKNVSSDTINIDFRDLNTVYLQLSNNRDIKQTGIVTSDSANVTLKNGNYVNRELTYNVNLDNQGLIKSMVFSNITINSKSKTIKIDF
ncbi:unknown [Clostridium sp. CAG:921]|nr:unknown [Clostridium sp. CAG:921]